MKKQRILLTGEKKENALPLSLFLEGQDFCVTVEADFCLFLEQFRSGKKTIESFDLLVAGTHMSEILLVELLSEMQSRKIGCPFIMISDNGSQSWVKRIIKEYAGIYVVQPTEPEELVNVAQKLLKKYEK